MRAKMSEEERRSGRLARQRARVKPGQVWQSPVSPLGRTIRITSFDGFWARYELITGYGPRSRKISVHSLLVSYRLKESAPKALTVDQRLMARHLLQELRENAALVRNAVEPATGVARVTDQGWFEQWASLKKNLDYFTDEVVGNGRPATPYGRI